MRKLVWFLCLGIPVLMAAAFLALFERVEMETESHPKWEALTQPYLALERFLTRQGIEVLTVDSFSLRNQLPPPDEVILLFTPRKTLNMDFHRKLNAWVEAGGHLITTVRQEEDTVENDPILALLHAAVMEGVQADEARAMPLEAKEEPLLVKWNTPFYIFADQSEPILALPEENLADLVIYSLGEGYLTLLSEVEFLTNQRIGRFDHAALLSQLIHLDDAEPGRVHLIMHEAYPALSRLLKKHAWMSLATLLAFAAFLLWALMPRLGPIKPQPPPERRRLLEHIEASGHFWWENQCQAHLLALARQGLMRQLHRSRPGWIHLPDEKLMVRLQQLTQLRYLRVETAFKATDIENEERFLAIIQDIETMRRAL